MMDRLSAKRYIFCAVRMKVWEEIRVYYSSMGIPSVILTGTLPVVQRRLL